jgi:glucosylceramidase
VWLNRYHIGVVNVMAMDYGSCGLNMGSAATDEAAGRHVTRGHRGDSRSGQVDFNIEYYDMGHLTKFVRPGASRIASTSSTSVPNVAWLNPDASKALVAYNASGSTQSLHVVWGGESFTFSLPARTSATFTWTGTQGGTAATGAITGIAGKCVDVAGAATANGTAVQLFDCNASGAQTWIATPGHDLLNPASGRCLDATGPSSASGTHLQIWDCTGGSNQKWTVPGA